jgi:uncharacterized protein (DUF1501 family)
MKSLPIATRRDFLHRGLGLVGVGSVLPHFLARSSLAASPDQAGERIVVGLLLTGGPDGLSVVPPYGHTEYYQHRKTLAYSPEQVIKLNDEVGLHPQLTGFKAMLDEGRLAVILGTAYPNYNLSHFVSRDFWEAGGGPGSTGWLGRYVDQACPGVNDPTLNVAVGPGRLPLLVTGKEHPGIAFSSPDSFRFTGVGSPEAQALYARLNETAPPESDLQFISQTAVNANRASARLGELAASYRTPAPYPDTQFGNSVRTIAGFINGGLPARAYYAAQGIAVFGGFDTHADQIGRLDTLLDELDQTVSAFYLDLARCGNADRVLTFTFSEFGRRVQENYSGGTDHGLAQPMFVMGAGVKAGVHGKQPPLNDLDERGNLKMQLDFRRVYAAILEKWLRTSSAPILGGEYAPLDCLA